MIGARARSRPATDRPAPPVPRPAARQQPPARRPPGAGRARASVRDALSGVLEQAVARRTPARCATSAVEPGAVRRPMIQRNGDSAALLTTLATPRVFENPQPGLQTYIVRLLEAGIADDVERFEKESADWTSGAKLPAPARDGYELFLGGIELTDLPDSDAVLVRRAELVDLPDNALSPSVNSYELVVACGVADDLVRNTLQTMIAAEQIKYLRKSGLLDDGTWKIVVEIHYLRLRPKTAWGLHKDTRGQTLFVNLNYETSHAIAGPEYLLNPPASAMHDEDVRESLPTTFLADLEQTRARLGEHETIMAPTVPAHGVVAFVDEAIHHSTPRYGHRTITGAQLGEFLRDQDPRGYADAEDTYDNVYMTSRWPLATYRGDTWKRLKLVSMVRDPARQHTKLQDLHNNHTRQDLAAVGLSDDDIETMLARYGGEGFQSVNIPAPRGQQARPRAAVTREGGRPLKRQMSDLALRRRVPAQVTGNRSFFRTWVRAVRR